MGLDRIKRVEQIKDLGVIFDERLTFVPHIEEIIAKSNRLFGILCRFSKEIHYPPIALKILNVYIIPIIEYGSIIWWQKRLGLDKRLEKILHKTTRLVLSTSFRPNQPNYVTFDERLRRLNLITLVECREITSAIFMIKLFKGELASTMTDRLENMRHRNLANTRNPLLFDLPRNVPVRSPLFIGLNQVNQLRNVFSLEESVDAIRKKLKCKAHSNRM